MRLSLDRLAAWVRAEQSSRLEEAEINPLFVLPHGVLAADGLVVLA